MKTPFNALFSSYKISSDVKEHLGSLMNKKVNRRRNAFK